MRTNINVFFPYYQCGDAERQNEIDLCLHKNIKNKKISKLYILIDDGSEIDITNEKVEIIQLTARPTYRLWIELTQSLRLDGYSILCNSDIYFDESISLISQVLSQGNEFLALSRWESIQGRLSIHKNPHWSQDTWGFKCTDTFSKEMMRSLDFPMGVPRCDNKIAYIFATRGWSIKNPCQFIKSIHMHETGMRTYHKKLDLRIIGGVAYVHPGEDIHSEAQLDYDIWSINAHRVKKVGLNKSLDKWLVEAATAPETYGETNQVGSSRNLPFEQAHVTDFLTAIKGGKLVYSQGVYFSVFEYNGTYYFKNFYNFEKRLKISSQYSLKDVILQAIIPSVITTHIERVTNQAKSKDDIDFWQYPCATEKQAYENHLKFFPSPDVNPVKQEISIYVPVPWATYVDKKNFGSYYLVQLSRIIEQYKNLAAEFGYKLKAHSVCQHIHWIRILDSAQNVGITDLHLSHKDSKSEKLCQERGYKLSLHGWPLIAVNYEVKERAIGMERKPIAERKLLASFIGAQMPHYRNDSRLKLFEVAKAGGRTDIFVDLGAEWHFNKVVYEEQVLNREVAEEHLSAHDEKTFKYNIILSDSKFSLCPEGAGPNTLRFWESIAVGSIPIIFSKDLSILSDSEIGNEILKNVVVWNEPINSKLFDFMASQKQDYLNRKSENLIRLYKSVASLICF
jgi:hypothetical protein